MLPKISFWMALGLISGFVGGFWWAKRERFLMEGLFPFSSGVLSGLLGMWVGWRLGEMVIGDALLEIPILAMILAVMGTAAGCLTSVRFFRSRRMLWTVLTVVAGLVIGELFVVTYIIVWFSP